MSNDLGANRYLNFALWMLVALAVAGSSVFALWLPWDSARLGITVSLAGLCVGLFFGFMFGVPKVTPFADAAAAAREGKVQSSSAFQEVVDWLLKILLGAGLTQMEAIGRHLGSMAEKIGQGFDGTAALVACRNGEPCAGPAGVLPGSYALAMSLLLIHPIVGFLLGFLWTRLRLSPAFKKVELHLGTPEKLVASLAQGLADELRAKANGERVEASVLEAARQLSSFSPDEFQSLKTKQAWAFVVLMLAKHEVVDEIVRKKAQALLEESLKDPKLQTSAAAEVKAAVAENELFQSLYQPDGFDKVLTLAPPEKWQALSAMGKGYVVCALGEKFKRTKDERLVRDAFELMKQAIDQDPAIAGWFRMLLTNPPGSVDDDLAELAKVEPFSSWVAAQVNNSQPPPSVAQPAGDYPRASRTVDFGVAPRTRPSPPPEVASPAGSQEAKPRPSPPAASEPGEDS